MKNISTITIILVVIAAGAGFFGGMKYQQSHSTNLQMTARSDGSNGMRTGQFGQRGGGRGGATVGEVLSRDDKSITIKLMDGSSKIVLLSDKTPINKTTQATMADITVGTRVAVFGAANSDGSVTAQNVQLNPMFGSGRQPNQAPKSADAKEIVIQASNYSFSPATVTLKKGEKTRIVLKNTGGMHDFKVDELNISTAIISDGQEDFVEFTPDKAGTFEFYCSVANHRAMGMKGSLIVQ